MRLRNDNDRKQFVNDLNNWKMVSQMPGVRITCLEYEEAAWYRLEIWRTYTVFDYKLHEHKEVMDWYPIVIYTMRNDNHSFGDPISESQIVRKIKEMDKERKNK